MMVGISNFKELCVFLALSVTAEQQVMADGSISIGDAVFAMSPLKALPSAIAGVSEIPAEVKDMDPAEAAEVSAAIKEALKLESSAAEAIAEQFMDIGLQLAAAALATKNAKAA